MLKQTDILTRIEEITGVKRNLARNVLQAAAQVLREEVTAGQDFSLPGLVRVSYGYSAPRRKGDVYVGFGGEEKTADKNVPEKVRLSVNVPGGKNKLLPKKGTKAWKTVVARKSGR